MERASSIALPAAMGIAAGMRSMSAPAVLVWAAKRRTIRIAGSSLASLAVGTTSGRVMNLALTELLVDKLPFAPNRTHPGPLAWRALSGAACGATVASANRTPAWQGAIAGAAGAFFGAFAGSYARKKLGQQLPDIAAALIEDAFAISLAAAVVWRLSRKSPAG